MAHAGDPAQGIRVTLARHGETVHNAAGRMQGNAAHTPLTRAGIAQAEAMGAALAAHLRDGRPCDIWASPAGRTLQTAAIVAEHLACDFFAIRTDPRLLELDVGAWQGRLYTDVIAQAGPILCPERRLFIVPPPQGEWYPAVAGRLEAWRATLAPDRDVLVIGHGMTLRVLRGLLAGGESRIDGVPIAGDAPQGTIFWIEAGVETCLARGTGRAATRAV